MAKEETLSDKKARGKPMSDEKGAAPVQRKPQGEGGNPVCQKRDGKQPIVSGKARECDNKKNSKRKRKLKQTGSPS
jgi:hypothetical protein